MTDPTNIEEQSTPATPAQDNVPAESVAPPQANGAPADDAVGAAEAAPAGGTEPDSAPTADAADAVAAPETGDAGPASGPEDAAPQDTATAEGDSTSPNAQAKQESGRTHDHDADVRIELRRLMEFALEHPAIGPTVAELAFKLGEHEIGERVLRMGLDSDVRGVEFHWVAAEVARREGRSQDALAAVADGLKSFVAAPPKDEGEGSRLLHLIRLGFAVVLFDMGGADASPDFSALVSEELPKLGERFAEDAFFHALLAQAAWSSNREQSESLWDAAVTFDDGDSTWNARGTWYKEAEQDLPKAEDAYRKGLKVTPRSGLLLHNLAQVLMDRAEAVIGDDEGASSSRQWLNEADKLLRKAQGVSRHRLRRHIHETVMRMKELRDRLPAEKAPEVGAVVRGRVKTVVPYGAFLTLGGGHSGLLHVSEIAHERIEDPKTHLKVGDSLEVKVVSVETRDGELRIGLSRRAVLPAPEGGAQERRNDNRGKGRGRGKGQGQGQGRGRGRGDNQRRNEPKEEKMGTLGELLLAKLSEKE